MSPRKISDATWAELKKLFLAGWSIGQLAKRFDLPKGSIAAHAARGKWSRERLAAKQPLDVLPNGQIVSEDPELDAIRKIVTECKRAALAADAQTAKILALKSLEAAEAVEISSLPDIREAQAYRSNLWPAAADPALQITFPNGTTLEGTEPTKLILEYAHEYDRNHASEKPATDATIVDNSASEQK